MRHRPQGDSDRCVAFAFFRPHRHGLAGRVRLRLAAGEVVGLREIVLRRSQVLAAGGKTAHRSHLCGRPVPGGSPLRRGQRHRRQGGLQPSLPHEERVVVHPSRPAQPRYRRAGRRRSTRRWACSASGIATESASAAWSTTPATPRATPAAFPPTGSTTWNRRSAAAMGKDCVVVFLQGACGDITQVNNQNPFVNPARKIGADWSADASAPRRSRCC